MKIIMIGHGMVGHKFIESVLEQAGDEVEFTILAEEPHLAYDRVHLTEYFQRQNRQKTSVFAVVILPMHMALTYA